PLMRRLGCSHAAVQHALLEEAALWLSEGKQFGAAGEGFFRMNLATPRSLVKDGLDRLEHAVRFLETKS
ncbi:MAG TPA: hypothetical protein VKA06_06215, partial [Spirochaetia bacterium]|nr:hypothetical protein [Spirochaetia bacterium]